MVFTSSTQGTGKPKFVGILPVALAVNILVRTPQNVVMALLRPERRASVKVVQTAGVAATANSPREASVRVGSVARQAVNWPLHPKLAMAGKGIASAVVAKSLFAMKGTGWNFAVLILVTIAKPNVFLAVSVPT